MWCRSIVSSKFIFSKKRKEISANRSYILPRKTNVWGTKMPPCYIWYQEDILIHYDSRSILQIAIIYKKCCRSKEDFQPNITLRMLRSDLNEGSCLTWPALNVVLYGIPNATKKGYVANLVIFRTEKGIIPPCNTATKLNAYIIVNNLSGGVFKVFLDLKWLEITLSLLNVTSQELRNPRERHRWSVRHFK